jgi:DNA-binding SARP family transcriptional activator
MFWPDSGDERARAALSRAIYFLRRELGEGIIVARGDEITVGSERLWCDAAAFEQLFEQGKPREALELYRGDLLPGFFTADANGFEEWLERERARMRESASAAAWELTGAAEAKGNLALAAHWARRAVELAPFREAGIRRLLGLLDALGDRAGAVHAYEEFAAQLQAELELEPAPETTELVSEIRQRERTGPGRPPADVPVPAAVTMELAPATPRLDASTRVRRRWFAAGVAAAIMVGTPAGLLARRKNVDPVMHRVHVTRFTNLTRNREFDELGRAVADRIVQSLAGTGVVEVTASDDERHSTSGETSTVTRQAGPAQRGIPPDEGGLIEGKVYFESGRLRIQAWITDVTTRRIVWVVPGIAVDTDAVSSAIDDLQERTTGAITALSSRRFATWLPTASSPPRFAAFQPFAQGVDLHFKGAHKDGVQHLLRAVDADPSFIAAQLQLALAWTAVFEEGRTDSIAAELNRRREHLNPLQRHWLDWLLALGAEDPLGAYRAVKAAASLAPERFDYHVAEWAYKLNRPREASDILTRLGPDSPYNHESEYWALLTRALHARGKAKQELSAARSARSRFPDRIEMLGFELAALASRGRTREVRALIDTALAFPRPKVGVTTAVVDMPGPGLWPGRLMITAAEEFRAHGFDAAANETLKRAIRWYETETHADHLAQRQRFELAKAYYLTQDWSAAEGAFRSLDGADTNVVYIGYLGAIAAHRGDTIEARRVMARLDTLRPALSRPRAIAGYWQSKISAILGDEELAIRRLIEAFGPQGRSGLHVDRDYDRIQHSSAFREWTRPKG